MADRLSYRDAGVDLDAAQTHTANIAGLIAGGQTGFAAAHPLPPGMREPLLVSCTDGVGTKVVLAKELDRVDGLGQDLVAMCVNDLVCTGARPLVFLDYLAVGTLEPELASRLVHSIAAACRAVGCALAGGETAEGALAVVRKGIAKHGVPQRLLTDNGSAFNTSRRGWEAQLTAYVTALGVSAITGKPGKPTTQGKNERFHQTLFRWLDKQPLAESIEQLQEQVDRFDVIYNTERPHQGLPGRVTPQRAWDATPVAEPPRPRLSPAQPVLLEPAGEAPGVMFDIGNMWDTRVTSAGFVRVRGVTYQIARELAGHTIYVEELDAGVRFRDHTGELLLEHPWPEPGVKHVSNGRPRGAGTKRPENIRDVIHSTGTTDPPGEYRRVVRADGRVSVRNVVYGIGKRHAGTELLVIIDGPRITFWHTRTGELIAEHQVPPPGVKIVGFTKYNMNRTREPEPPVTPEVSPMS